MVYSEGFSPYHQPGSVLFSQPAEVDNWCQSISFQEGFPLSPPDTASDCAPSDCADMNGPSWNQVSLPEESWSAAPAPEHSTFLQTSGGDWQSQRLPLTTQDLQSMNSTSWLDVSQGPVDMGLSPVLSHESQSSHKLHSVSEPDLPLLPPGLDLSFIGEPAWEAAGSVVYTGYSVAPQDFVSSPEVTPAGTQMSPVYAGSCASQPLTCGPQQPVYYFQGGAAPYPRRTISDPSIAQKRPLLPRSESSSVSSVHIHGQSRASQPQSGSGRADTVPRVSNASGLARDVAYSGLAPVHASGHMVQSSQHARMSPVGHGVLTPSSDTTGPCAQPYFPEPSIEQFGNMAQYERRGPNASSMSYANGSGVLAIQPQDLKLVDSKASGSAHYPSSSSNASISGESDEGRHRNHPLYSKGPEPDGMYHCPFTTDPNCQHKPTKLKCNYEYDYTPFLPIITTLHKNSALTYIVYSKFIDSHLKPFRCKVEACSKQEFSSTACLLRHEREAHGMHGHGDRPHLCYYPGCERGIPGNGFPRRYNLFDHMKRVHDHKDEPSPDRAGSDTQGRKAVGRKRKATESLNEEPVAQRRKVQTLPPTPPMAPVRQTGFIQQAPVYPIAHVQDYNKQQQLYSQWANQRQLLEFQMNTVTSPDDEASLQRLSQNVEELRRLSQQARHG